MAVLSICQITPTSTPVDGLLVVTRDTSLLSKVTKEYKPGQPFDELKANFIGERYLIREWGRRSAILFDLEIPFLQHRRDETTVLAAFATHIKDDYTIDPSTLSESERAAYHRVVRKYTIAAEAERLNPATIGISFGTVFTVQGPDGRSFVSQRRVVNDRTKRRDAELQKRPFNNNLNHLARAEIDRRLKESEESNIARDEWGCRAFGIASENLPHGLEEAGKEMRKIVRDILFARQEASLDLGKRMGIHGSRLDGDQPVSALTKAMREDLESSFMEQWQINGFKSPSEAATYFDSITSVRLGTSLSIAYCTEPSDGLKPPIFFAFPLGNYSGIQP